MAGKPRYTLQEVIDALAAARGLVSVAARRLGCKYDTVLNYMKRYPQVRAVCQGYRERMTDVAELRFWEAINRGEPWAIAMQLKTQGRDRGYVERLDFTFVLSRAVQELAREKGLTVEEVMQEAQAILAARG